MYLYIFNLRHTHRHIFEFFHYILVECWAQAALRKRKTGKKTLHTAQSFDAGSNLPSDSKPNQKPEKKTQANRLGDIKNVPQQRNEIKKSSVLTLSLCHGRIFLATPYNQNIQLENPLAISNPRTNNVFRASMQPRVLI